MIGDQRTGGDAAHAELRDRAEAQPERAAENDLADRGREHHQRRQLHVAGAAQNAGHRVHQPRDDRAAEKYLRIGDRLLQHVAAAAEQFQQRRAENQHPQHEDQPEAEADQQRMRRQRRGAIDIAGAERAGDGGGHATAHGAAGHGHGQDHGREHQRHRGQQFHAQPANIGGLGDHHAGARGERNHVRPGEPHSVRRIGPSTNAFFAGAAGGGSGVRPRLREFRQRRGRTFLLPARGFGPAARCFLARPGMIPRAPGARGACWIAGRARALSERKAQPGSHLTGNSCRPREVRTGIALVRRAPPGNSTLRKHILLATCVVALALPLAACNDLEDTATAAESYGPSPPLPQPKNIRGFRRSISPRQPLAQGAKPTAASGMRSTRLPPGSIIRAGLCPAQRRRAGCGKQRAAEAGGRQGHQGLYLQEAQKWAGAGVPSANRITLLRDTDGDGVAETRTCSSRASIRRSAWRWSANELYVANTDAIMKFPYQEGETRSARLAEGRRPAGRADQSPLDQEPGRQPRRLEALCHRRLQQQCRRERHRGGGGARRDARGRACDRPVARVRLRPAQSERPGWNPQTGELWAVVNERDELGNDLVPDYMTSVKRRRLLWLAVQLLRRPCGHARRRSGPIWSRKRWRRITRWAHIPPRSGWPSTPASCFRRDIKWRLHRPARLVEPQAARRLQGDLRAVQGRQAVGPRKTS